MYYGSCIMGEKLIKHFFHFIVFPNLENIEKYGKASPSSDSRMAFTHVKFSFNVELLIYDLLH